ncbi:unnamed protein product [Gongylonema pulchrum]|uniref:Uncharacterized protein n=1 Tax=Gongylonema pulchrum TaxID=637853 RepID=A0A183DH75_9BILA|nr:unnamed protein product [Gongylonema pulchrum]
MLSKTKSASSFVKIAYPNRVAPENLHSVLQPFAKIDSKQDLLSAEVAHLREESAFTPRTVYDLDSLLLNAAQQPSSATLTNDDRDRYACILDVLQLEKLFGIDCLRILGRSCGVAAVSGRVQLPQN